MNELPPLKFTWHYGWNVIAISIVFQSLCMGIHYFSFTLWVVPWSEEFGVARSSIMLMAVLSQVLAGLSSPFAGRALDRYPSHILIVAGIAVFATGLLLISATTAIWQILAIFMILLPPGVILTSALAAQTLATRWFTGERGMALSVSTLGSSVGGLAIPPVAAVLLEGFGWRITFVVLGLVIALVAAPLTWLVLKRRPPEEELLEMQYRDSKAPPRPRTLTTRAILKNSDFRTWVIGFLPPAMAFSAIQMNLGAYAHDLSIGAQQTGLLVSELSILMLLGRLAIGRYLDRHDHRVLYWLMAGGVSIAVVIASFSASFGALAAAIAFLGIFHSAYLPLASSMIIDRFGTRAFGQVMGLGYTFLGFGAFGSLIAALLHDLSGSYTPAFLFFLLLLLPAMWRMRRLSASDRHPRDR